MMNPTVGDTSREDTENKKFYSGVELVRQIIPSRRLADRIRDLCARVVTASENNLEPAISELRAALHEHN